MKQNKSILTIQLKYHYLMANINTILYRFYLRNEEKAGKTGVKHILAYYSCLDKLGKPLCNEIRDFIKGG